MQLNHNSRNMIYYIVFKIDCLHYARQSWSKKRRRKQCLNSGFAFYLILSIVVSFNRIERRKKGISVYVATRTVLHLLPGRRTIGEVRKKNKIRKRKRTHPGCTFTNIYNVPLDYKTLFIQYIFPLNSKIREIPKYASRGLYCPHGMLGGDKQLHSVSKVFYDVSRS